MFAEGAPAGFGDRNKSLRLFSHEGFLDFDVSVLFQGREMGAEVSIRQLEFVFKKTEVDLLGTTQAAKRSHNAETRRLMNNGIELAHARSEVVISAPDIAYDEPRENDGPATKDREPKPEEGGKNEKTDED